MWIGAFILSGTSTRSWLVVHRSGEVTSVTLPATFDGMPYARRELLDVAHGLVAVRCVDGLGIETVEVWSCAC